MSTTTQTASERITEEVATWPGVTAGPGSRGEFSFRLGRREIGHLHGDHALHIGFPKKVWHELHDQGRIDYHPVFPGKPGYASRRIETDEDVRDAAGALKGWYCDITRPATLLGTDLVVEHIEKHWCPTVTSTCRCAAARRSWPAAVRKAGGRMIIVEPTSGRDGSTAAEWIERWNRQLEAFTPKIGYPARWRDYSTLKFYRDDLLGHDHAGAILRLLGGGAEVRRDDDRLEAEERAVGAGLLGEDVDAGAGDATLGDGCGQRLLVEVGAWLVGVRPDRAHRQLPELRSAARPPRTRSRRRS